MSAIYKITKAIYDKEKRLKNGKETLLLVMELTKIFSQIFIYDKKMLDGELHTIGINTDLRDYYLSQILMDVKN